MALPTITLVYSERRPSRCFLKTCVQSTKLSQKYIGFGQNLKIEQAHSQATSAAQEARCCCITIICKTLSQRVIHHSSNTYSSCFSACILSVQVHLVRCLAAARTHVDASARSNSKPPPTVLDHRHIPCRQRNKRVPQHSIGKLCGSVTKKRESGSKSA